MKNLTRTAGTIGLLTISNLIFINAANAFSVTFDDGNGNNTNLADFNTGFESQYTGWSTTGDTTVQSIFQSISPQSGSGQALITNSCPNSVGTQCRDKDGGIRNDDSHINSTAGTFNYSDNDQINASVEASNLQSFLKLENNDLSIAAIFNGAEIPGVFRTPKEGSAIISDEFTVSDGDFTLSFDWNYLTNDGASTLGNQDFSFVTITGSTSGGTPVKQVIPLGDSSGNIPSTTSSNYAAVSGYDTYTSDLLKAGTYQVGFGVVDVDNVDRSSALLVDNFMVEEVPFDFSPTAGLGLVAGIFGFTHLRRKLLHGSDVDN